MIHVTGQRKIRNNISGSAALAWQGLSYLTVLPSLFKWWPWVDHDLSIAPLWKSGDYTGFALSFSHSVVLSLCHCMILSLFHYSDETCISLRPVCQSWSNFIWSISRVGERLHKVLGQIGSKLLFHGNKKCPLTYNGENNVSTFSLLFFIRSFSNLQITRTGIKSRTSLNFGQIRPLPTELGALEHLKNFL